jgi:cell fate regulator YaaT (PSP1 superfamily)
MLVKIQFKARRHRYFEKPEELDLEVGDFVIVEADRGIDLGRVIKFLKNLEPKSLHKEVKKIMRSATPDELEKYEESNIIEREAFGICKRFINIHGLQMKLVDVECQFDLKKITFYFTAPRRVDFRSLVRDLASVFRIRIDMRQIGVRDEARRLGGYGPCGYPLCCKTFLPEFKPVNLKTAKNQNLTINPSKISGTCGRLMCCLLYEDKFYEETASHFPDVESRVKLRDGRRGTIETSDPFNDEIKIEIDNGNPVLYTLEKYEKNILVCEKKEEEE